MTDVELQNLIKEAESLTKTFAATLSSTKLETDRCFTNITSYFAVIDNTLQQIKQKDDTISKRLEALEKHYRKNSIHVVPSLRLENVDPFEDDESLDELANIAFFGRSKSVPTITIRSPRSPGSSHLSPSASSESLLPPSAPPPPPITLTSPPSTPTSSTMDFSSVKLKSPNPSSSPVTPRVQSPSDALMSEMASKLLKRKSTSFNNIESALQKSPEKPLNRSAEGSSSSPNFRLSPAVSPATSPMSPRDVPFITNVVIPYEDLKSRKNLPPDINVAALEAYLSQGEFFQVFGMNRDKFNKLPRWQKDNRKKAFQLY